MVSLLRLLKVAAISFMPVAALTPTASAADVEAQYRSLFGEEANRVKATLDTKDDLDFANKLTRAADAVGGDPELQSLLYRRAFEYSSPHADGYNLAIQSMEALIRAQPSLRSLADENCLKLMERHFKDLGAAQRKAIAVDYTRKLTEVADAHVKADRLDDAVSILRRAVPVAAVAGAQEAKVVGSRLKETVALQEVNRKISDLKERLAKQPDDFKFAESLAVLFLTERHTPKDALTVAAPCRDPLLKRIIELANRDLSTLTEEEALTLADWYKSRSERATSYGASRTVLQAVRCYERFLALHAKQDGTALRAKLAVESLQRTGPKPAAGGPKDDRPGVAPVQVAADMNSFAEFLDRLPADAKPMENGVWDTEAVGKANDWVSANLKGKTLGLTAAATKIYPPTNDGKTGGGMYEGDETWGRLRVVFNAQIFVDDAEAVKTILELGEGKPCRLTGRVSYVTVTVQKVLSRRLTLFVHMTRCRVDAQP